MRLPWDLMLWHMLFCMPLAPQACAKGTRVSFIAYSDGDGIGAQAVRLEDNMGGLQLVAVEIGNKARYGGQW